MGYISKFIIQNKYAYILAEVSNTLFQYDISEDRVKKIYYFKASHDFKPHLFTIAKGENKLYFLPYTANEFAVLDLNSDEISEIAVFDNSNRGTDIRIRTMTYASVENYFYCFPGMGDKILQFDSKTNNIVNQIDIKENYKKEYLYFCTSSCYVYNNYIILALYEENSIGIFNINTKDVRYIHIQGTADIGFCAIQGCENRVYLLDKNGNILELLLENDTISLVASCNNFYSPNEIRKCLYERGFNAFLYSNCIYFISGDVRYSKKYSLLSKTSDAVFSKELIGHVYTDDATRVYYSSFEEGIIYLYTNTDVLYGVDAISSEIKFQCNVKVDNSKLFNSVWNNYNDKHYTDTILESQFYTLERFLQYDLLKVDLEKQ